MDEAGYGPNLGPLLITLTRWKTPAAPQRCRFYHLLRDVLCVDGHCDWTRLHIADSKLVFTGKDGFRSLESSALALLAVIGCDTTSFRSVWKHLVATADDSADPLPPWYDGDIPLPVAADSGHVQSLADSLRRRFEKTGVELVGIHSDLVIEGRFNRLTGARDSNKALALSRLSFLLLRSAWSPEASAATLIVGDKHGGRNRYDELLAEILEDHMIFRVQESRSLSRYRVGSTELRFQVAGEEHLPVACASIVSKYLRELSMDLINEFWSRHCPGIKPTRGYPGDASRFRREIESARAQLEIAEEVLWRSR